MHKSAIGLVAILALALAMPAAQGGPALVRAVPVAPTGATAPSGAALITLGAPGTYTIPINFTINVPNLKTAVDIQAFFILNNTALTTLSGTPSFVTTGLGSPDAGLPAGTALTPNGPFSTTPWEYTSNGCGGDHVFGPGTSSHFYNYSFVWTLLTGPSNGFNFWKVLNVTFTVPSGSVSTASPAQFIIVGAGNQGSSTNFDSPFCTPWSGATNINVIPEFFFGTLAAVVLPLLALAGYLHFRRNGQSPAVSLNS